MEKSPRHGKTDKTQKITLKQKIHGKWDFENRKQKNYGFNLVHLPQTIIVKGTASEVFRLDYRTRRVSSLHVVSQQYNFLGFFLIKAQPPNHTTKVLYDFTSNYKVVTC